MLLDSGPHTVVVTPRVRTLNRSGGWQYSDGDPVTIAGVMVQANTASESAELGLEAVTTYTVIGRTWPGGPHSKVEWNGRLFVQVGEPRVYANGRRTRHVDVAIQAVGAEPK